MASSDDSNIKYPYYVIKNTYKAPIYVWTHEKKRGAHKGLAKMIRGFKDNKQKGVATSFFREKRKTTKMFYFQNHMTPLKEKQSLWNQKIGFGG